MSRIGLASAFMATVVVTSISPVRVIRAVPEADSGPTPEIAITFDRPVAGGLRASADPRDFFSVDPDVPGRVEWRDPFTVRLIPDGALTPGERYTVTLANTFVAMDGNRLARPYRHSFTVRKGRVLNGFPMRKEGHAQPRHVGVRPVLSFLVRPWIVDSTRFARRTRIRVLPPCRERTIGVEWVTQRPMNDTDPAYFRWEEWHPRIDDSDDGRRVVEVRPTEDLPRGCAGELEFPADDGDSDATYTWAFRTYGPQRVVGTACSSGNACPVGPLRIRFDNPVRGADLLRHTSITPAVEFAVFDTAAVQESWSLTGPFQPRSTYAVTVSGELTDLFEQPLGSDTVVRIATTGYGTGASYEQGRLLVEGAQSGSLPVHHINADTLHVISAEVPRRLEGAFLASRWGWRSPWDSVAANADTSRIAVPSPQDQGWISSVPLSDLSPSSSTLLAVRIHATANGTEGRHGSGAIALTQVTDLAIHARIGTERGMVWVTQVSDGSAKPGARVTLYDAAGAVRASGLTDATGVVDLGALRRSGDEEACERECYGFEGYVSAEVEGDRSLVGLSRYDPDLAPWRFDVNAAWGSDELPVAAAAFTERGIYRPGERVHAKVLLRRGPLGSLRVHSGDSVRLRWLDRERAAIRDTVVDLTAYGSATSSLDLNADAAVGNYVLEIDALSQSEWTTVGRAPFRVAEYRPPEFLVEAAADRPTSVAGDTATVTVTGRYLFGAPMVGAATQWTARLEPLLWGLRIPGADGFSFGSGFGWWDRGGLPGTEIVASGVDSLDARGATELALPLSPSQPGVPYRATLQATIADANRQTSTAVASLTVHPGAFYIGARTAQDAWFWTAGEPAEVEVVAFSPAGDRVEGVEITGQVVRREWHRVRRVRNGNVEEVGQWVTDTVASCAVVSSSEPERCAFVPPGGGSYRVELEARDHADRLIRTEVYRWASGPDWVPWNDESKLNMDVIVDRESYDIGDTATVLFASPFVDAEAWVTIEREQVLESHRLRLESGATTLRIPITEALSPNAYVSILVAKGRTADPTSVDDPGRPAIRVGYAQLRVLPEVKRLVVEVEPVPAGSESESMVAAEARTDMVTYGPGDTARFDIRVRDRAGLGAPSEVTLWAVDEGILSLTGYATPDPVSMLYRERGLGVRLGSNLTSVAARIPAGQKGRRAPGGGGGDDAASVLRSRFQTTAFFLGSIETDSDGNARAEARLPDNLTTFRVMAIAATTGDRYGSGDTSILVTRPLLARAALPRFIRPSDSLLAGVVVNHRLGVPLTVGIEANAEGIVMDGDSSFVVELPALRAGEARFDYRAIEGDTAHFEFFVEGRPTRAPSSDAQVVRDTQVFRDAQVFRDSHVFRDAVRVSLPIKPDHHPLASTASGSVAGVPRTVVLPLRGDVDPERSRVTVRLGTAPVSILRAMRDRLDVYAYQCTEQVSSRLFALLAMYRLDEVAGLATDDQRRQIRDGVRILQSRQRSDGAMGYWDASDWSTAWLTSYAGRVLVTAAAAGFEVDSTTVARLADYAARALESATPETPPHVRWVSSAPTFVLGERLMVADFLSRAGQPALAVENELLANVSLMRWEDRALLAEVLHRSGRRREAVEVLGAAWNDVRSDGNKALAPDPTADERHYFRSPVRGTARLLSATAQIQSDHPRLGALLEGLIDRARARSGVWWNTQDYAHAALAAADLEALQRGAVARPIRLRGAPGVVADLTAGIDSDTTVTLDGLVTPDADGNPQLRLALGPGPVAAEDASGAPVYFFVTVHEVPRENPVDPVDQGIAMERWYEDLETGEPLTEAEEGSLVRVVLRVTTASDRQFVVVDDPLPAGLEAVDLSLRTVRPPGARFDGYEVTENTPRWPGRWSAGLWSPFEHQEIRDDRVLYSTSSLAAGSYQTTYVARATTVGTFVAPPAHAEEMYNPAVAGRTGGSTFIVRPRSEP